MEEISEEAKEYRRKMWRLAWKRKKQRDAGLPVDPSPAELERAKRNRDRWYALALAIEETATDSKGYANAVGIKTANGLNQFINTYGAGLAAKYGKLPWREGVSPTLRKYMEEEEYGDK